MADRQTGVPFNERVPGGALIRLAYSRAFGRFVGPLLFARGWPSRFLGRLCDTRMSRLLIPRFIRNQEIDISEAEAQHLGEWQTFNAFFSRRLKNGSRPYAPDTNVFVSPADSRLTASTAQADTFFQVKLQSVKLGELVGDGLSEPDQFYDGTLLVFRLSPADYHRFHFPAAGRVKDTWDIPGRYETVNPLGLNTSRRSVYMLNRRRVSVLDLHTFGEVVFIEVGAFGVGCIVSSHNEARFEKMTEKGFFKFGASAVIVLLQKDRLRVDPDIARNNRSGCETRVHAGERIGVSC